MDKMAPPTQYQPLTEQEREGFYPRQVASIIPAWAEIKPIGEQSTVTVLVASAFCCCFLFLGCVASACGYIFLLTWGAYILDNADGATSSNNCEDAYHIWMFCLLNEMIGVGITICGCQEACRIYSTMAEGDGGEHKGAPFPMTFHLRYGAAMLITFVFFLWGMIEWFQISDSCINDYNNKYEALLLLFRIGVIADAIILLVVVMFYMIQIRAAGEKGGQTLNEQ
jgi:hypothetical protein